MPAHADASGGGDHIRFAVIECKNELLKSLKWLKSDASTVVSGELLATAGSLSEGNEIQLFAPVNGLLQHVQPPALRHTDGSDAATSMVEVAHVRYCTHPLKKKRVCMMCLETVDEDDANEEKSVHLVLHGQVLQMNAEEATKLDHDKLKRRLDAKKLSLVLDLDHTLLHAVRSLDVLGTIPDLDDVHRFFIPGVLLEHVVKLRPGLVHFLHATSQLYDLHIYTHGTRVYAEQMAKILDPNDQFFHDRIVARTDTPDVAHKSLKMLFPSSDDSMIVILDDRKDVWTENADNVLLIEPYHFFKCTAEINNAAGRGVLELDLAQPNGEDEYLHKALQVLQDVHKRFYADEYNPSVEQQTSGQGRNVKDILIERRQEILKNCCIVFSGVFPVGSGRAPESQFLWRLVESLGAKASITMENFPITHLVLHPARVGTQKHVQARGMATVKVVVPEWIFQCAKEWTHVDEKEFLVDTWKQKQEQLVQQQQQQQQEAAAAAATAAAAAATAPPTAASGAAAAAVQQTRDIAASCSSDLVDNHNATSSDHKSLAEDATDEQQQDQQAPSGTRKSPRASALKKQTTVSDPTSAPPKKSVGFIDETPKDTTVTSSSGAAAAAATGKARRQSGSLVNRMRVKRPHHNPNGAAGGNVLRPGRVHVPRIPEKIGVVASGGTIDFLSKITHLTASVSQKRKDLEDSTTKRGTHSVQVHTQQPKDTNKDFDDAFQKLIAAEEMETENEQKRKLNSTDVRDQLRNRSRKRSRSSDDELDQETAAQGRKHMARLHHQRLDDEQEVTNPASLEQDHDDDDDNKDDDNDDDDVNEDELDDLDREIFG